MMWSRHAVAEGAGAIRCCVLCAAMAGSVARAGSEVEIDGVLLGLLALVLSADEVIARLARV
jgi:hypothetical protein